MKSLKTLLLTKSIAAALVAAGLASPAFGQSLAAPNISGTPDDGFVCRAGYTGSFNGTSFKCAKGSVITVVLECLNPTFPTYVTRSVVGTGVGKDLCTRNGVIISSTDLLTNLILGQDYVFAEPNPATITSRTTSKDQTEAAALGLSVSAVDTVAGQATIVLNGGVGQKDNANVIVTHYTFGIPNGGPIIAGGQAGNPFPAR